MSRTELSPYRPVIFRSAVYQSLYQFSVLCIVVPSKSRVRSHSKSRLRKVAITPDQSFDERSLVVAKLICEQGEWCGAKKRAASKQGL